MSTAAVVVYIGVGSRSRRRGGGSTGGAPLVRIASAAAAAGADELVIVVDTEELPSGLPTHATVLLDEAETSSRAGALRVAADWCARAGHEALVAGIAGAVSREDALVSAACWRALGRAGASPIVFGELDGAFAGLVRLEASVWSLLALEGDPEAGLRAHAGLTEARALYIEGPAGASEAGTSNDPDREAVARLLGRAPQGAFAVVVRDRAGSPVVIENAPFLDDGTPMPTSFWLVGEREREAVGRLEAAGGIRRAEEAVGLPEIARAHERYRAYRELHIDPAHVGPRPTGGVGGTRQGVKCLHAHLAWYLAGGGDPVGRFVALELDGELEGPVAAIDCGTNSTRLLICDRDGSRLVRETTITRLGEGVDETGRLDPAAIERTVAAIRRYRTLRDDHGVVRLRCAATSAARDASNASELFDKLTAALGVAPELLSGEEEGRTSYRGATAELDAAAGPYVVVDLGGGSTELVTATANGSGIELVSLPIGCVRVRERLLKTDPPTTEELEEARRYVHGLVDEALAAHPAFALGTMVGVAGTVSTLALLAAGAPEYVFGAAHHLHLTRDEVRGLVRELSAMTTAERARRPGIEAGRADVIAAGAVVLDEVMEVLGHKELICSESDILDGLAASLLDPKR